MVVVDDGQPPGADIFPRELRLDRFTLARARGLSILHSSCKCKGNDGLDWMPLATATVSAHAGTSKWNGLELWKGRPLLVLLGSYVS